MSSVQFIIRRIATLQFVQNWRNSYKKGSLLIEAMIGVLVFGLFVTAAYTTLLTGQESTRTGSDRVRGVMYTEQALEVAKNIRNSAFTSLTDGQNGFTIDENTGQWVLSGSRISRYGYNTYVNVTDVDADTKRVLARTSWKIGYNRSGSALLTAQLSDWRSSNNIGDWSSITETGSWFAGSTVNFNDLVYHDGYLYVASEIGAYGDGMYIFDITDPTNPVRVSTSFALNDIAHKPVVYRDRLYVALTGDPDIEAYDITTPTILSGATTPLVSLTLPGGPGRAQALAVGDSVLYVGATGDAGQDELYVYDITTGSMLTLIDSIDLSGNPSVYDIYLKDDYAFLATDSSNEVFVIDVSDPTSLSLHTARSFGVAQANGVRTSGTGFIVGMANSAFDEFAMVTGSGGVPSGNPSNLFGADLGASVNAIDIDPVGCYAFAATGNASNELQVRSARYKTVQAEGTANPDSGAARGVHYDLYNDLLYLATESGVYIYSPGPPTDCL